ncbi:MAG: hypothetical protein HS120_04325 [Burkholderiales bacterium]|nr:hypothetical protein [Burkholderiales bacterium]
MKQVSADLPIVVNAISRGNQQDGVKRYDEKSVCITQSITIIFYQLFLPIFYG